jgi:phenylacetate-CoA ligase
MRCRFWFFQFMPSILNKIYASSPVWAQNLGVTAYGMMWRHQRYGGHFLHEVEAFQARDVYRQQQWEEYQTEKLRFLLMHAAQHVPYYRQVVQQTGLSLQDLAHFTPKDLSRLPLLSKEEIRRDPDQFVDTTVNRKRLHTLLTSGTTGTPLAIKLTSEVHRLVLASYEARCRRWAGVDYKMSRVMIGGRVVVPTAESKPPFWRYNMAERQLYMSAFHISPANVPAYVGAINKMRPDYLVGYASAHYFLARMICELGLEVHKPRCVLTSSEKLTPEMRRTIETAYRCEVFDGYSGVEACCLVSECEHHHLHISPDVGIIELLNEEGLPVQPGELGEIVATGLLNFAQPLIRYRTGDQAVMSPDPCPCGRDMPVLRELVGRLEDTVIGPDGREMVRFHGIFVGLPNVRQGQIIQETLTHFHLRLVVEPGFNDEDRHTISQRFEERLGRVELTYEYLERIDPTERGKFRAVISKVQRKSSNKATELSR